MAGFSCRACGLFTKHPETNKKFRETDNSIQNLYVRIRSTLFCISTLLQFIQVVMTMGVSVDDKKYLIITEPKPKKQKSVLIYLLN